MKKILVLHDNEDKLSAIDSWVNMNYPRIDDYIIDFDSVFYEQLGPKIKDYDIIVFAGVLDGKSINSVLSFRSWWKSKIFVQVDDDIETRKFVTTLKKARVQTIKISTIGVS